MASRDGEGTADRRWLWPAVFVAALFLATTPGRWLLTDQAYAFATARRLVEAGTFVLTDRGQQRSPDVPWVSPGPRGDVRCQLHPLVPLLLVPLAKVDSALGFWGTGVRGGLVNALNPALVVLAVFLAGRRLTCEGVSYEATAFALLSFGLSWPTHHILRRGMAEPLLFLLLTVYALAAEAGSWRLRSFVLALLPWAHPTGLVLGATLAGLALLERRRQGLAEALAGAVSTAAFVAFWNYGFHGHWLKGGYASLEPAEGAFGALPPLVGLRLQLVEVLSMSPLPLAASAVVLASGPGRHSFARRLLPGAASLAALLALFSTHYFQGVPGEPTRHLAVVWPLFLVALARSWPASRPARGLLLALLGAQAFLSLRLFFHFDGRYHEGPLGLFYPSVLWVKLAIDGHTLPAALGLAVVVLAGVSLLETGRKLRSPSAPRAAGRGGR